MAEAAIFNPDKKGMCMKKYMAKALAEHSLRYDEYCRNKGKKREEQRVGLENLPLRERMCTGGRRERCLDTGILKNFLRSRLGQSFDAVFSEVCKTNCLDNFNQWELRRELLAMVEQNVVMVGARPYRPDDLPVFDDFYVHPVTGLLMQDS
jgi:hypothetical protein